MKGVADKNDVWRTKGEEEGVGRMVCGRRGRRGRRGRIGVMCGGQTEKRKAWGEWSVGEEGERRISVVQGGRRRML